MIFLFVLLALIASSQDAFATAAAPAHYPSPLTCLRNFHVSTNGSDTASCGAASGATACATIQGANNAGSIGGTGTTLTGGDCVLVDAGTYSTPGIGLDRSGTQNTASGYVAYVGAANHASKLVMNSQAYAFITITGNYIAIDGFEIDGHNIQGYPGFYSPSQTNTYNADQHMFNGGAGGHHHILLNNVIHGTGGSCAGTTQNDYDVVIANECYDAVGNNCSGGGTSALSWYEQHVINGFNPSLPWDTDPFHMKIIGNVVHDAGLSVNCGGHSDGNAIIIDDFRDTQNAPHIPYPYNILVAFNVVHHIGGRGVYEMDSDGITLANNTAYDTGLDLGSGAAPLVENCSTNNTWINNIGYGTGGTAASWQGAWCGAGWNSSTTWHNTLTFNGSVATDGPRTFNGNNNQIGINPLLTNINASPPDFHPLSGSPVLNAGTNTGMPSLPSGYAFFTPDGKLPPSPPNIGAFNLAGAGPPPPSGPLSINAGGPASGVYIADSGFSGGQTISNWNGAVDVSLVTNPAPQNVYQTERYGNFSYNFTNLIVGTSYTVRLHFTEDADTAAGQRIMTVSINGVAALTNYDIFADVGAQHKAVVKTFTKLPDSSGNLTVLFAPSGGTDLFAKVDAVEVLAPGGGGGTAPSVFAGKYPAPYTCTRNFFISTAGSDTATCGAAGTPCASIMGADSATSIGGTGSTLTAGDCVSSLAGTYNVNQMTPVHGGSSNTASGYVTYIGAPNHATKLNFSGSPTYGINPAANFMIFDGFEFAGNYTAAGAAGTGVQAMCFMTGSFQAAPIYHHYMMLNNIMHDCGGAGISFGTGDFFIAAGNSISNCANLAADHQSGIQVYEPIRVSGFTTNPWDTQTYHIQILGNVVHDCAEKETGSHSDGNGIELFDWQLRNWTTVLALANGTNTTTASKILHIDCTGANCSTVGIVAGQYVVDYTNPNNLDALNTVVSTGVNTVTVTNFPLQNTGNFDTYVFHAAVSNSAYYPYKGLVAGNLVYHNGGAGIKGAMAINADMYNNTAYNNNQDATIAVHGGEIAFTNSFANINVFNNVAYANPGATNNLAFQADGNAETAPLMVTANNVFFGGTAGNCAAQLEITGTATDAAYCTAVTAANPLTGTNPLFTNTGNCQLWPAGGSPIMTMATALPSGVLPGPLVTADGIVMPPTPNIGAYMNNHLISTWMMMMN